MVTAHPAERPLRPTEILAASRGVFSDSQPFFALMAGYAEGSTLVSEAVWEHRYGFPEPQRLPSGYRRYTPEDVETLRRVQAYRRRGLSVHYLRYGPKTVEKEHEVPKEGEQP